LLDQFVTKWNKYFLFIPTSIIIVRVKDILVEEIQIALSAMRIRSLKGHISGIRIYKVWSKYMIIRRIIQIIG
jgi:hypothetical protein